MKEQRRNERGEFEEEERIKEVTKWRERGRGKEREG
jgi:hypothetical protein